MIATHAKTKQQLFQFKLNLLRATILCYVLIGFSVGTFAQKIIRIETKDNLLLLGVGKDSTLKQLYLGAKVNSDENFVQKINDSKQAYTSYGNEVENIALRVTHADGNLTTDLVFVSSSTEKTDSNTSVTKIILKDKYYPDEVTLFYKTYNEQNIIEQWMTFTHKEKGTVTLYNFASAALNFQTPN